MSLLLQASSFASQVVILCIINMKVLMSADLRYLQAEHLEKFRGSTAALTVHRHTSLQTDTDSLVA